MSESSEVGNHGPGQIIAGSRLIRLAIFILANTFIAACAVFSVVKKYNVNEIGQRLLSFKFSD